MHIARYGPTDGRRVLLLHGGGVAGWMWEPLRAHLGDEHRILIPDLPGHGRSADEPYVSHAQTTAALAGLLEDEARPAMVVGFSLGAQLAVHLASAHPRLVDHAVIVSAQAVPMRATRPTLALLGATAGLARREWFARLQARQLFVPDELVAEYVQTSAGISRETLLRTVEENLRFTPPPRWRAFPGAASILVGAEEKGLMKRSAAALHRDLPHSALEVVDGCGHGIPLQRPSWLAAHLGPALDAHPDPR
ncbi:alpha/beta fold hydrolase [Microbacterium sp. Se5.02b]|uniref:alpha/beta fold hydrolase n=1 Tax=Microbacterium sp. Se5.02b TaxID=2864103 RepID=UPI001C68FA6A|nr:alpha/beta hydrolase [Microbacterium sp. Se5.02b]QYM65669.1 alpha/beta hydrolase [Microbacterium sp. Se5.02b]